MEEKILQVIAANGLESICIALGINVLTALIKLPIKHLANKTKNGANVTRFIVFLPVLLGFALSAIYIRFIAHGGLFGKEFMTLWLTSSSLSLTFYAIFEKLVPPKNKAESAAELAASKEIIDKIQSSVNGDENDEQENEKDFDAARAESGVVCKKIVLRGNHEDKIE